MKTLIVYATTEGQTRKIARYAADMLVDVGHSVELVDARDAEDTDVARFDAAILAGSVHGGRFQPELARFAAANADRLRALDRTMFMAVSLTAAGDDADDWEGLQQETRAFLDGARWRPDRVEHVAGAFRFAEYDFFKAWMMRRIARERDAEIDPRGDTEFTDWEALRMALRDWSGAAAPA